MKNEKQKFKLLLRIHTGIILLISLMWISTFITGRFFNPSFAITGISLILQGCVTLFGISIFIFHLLGNRNMSLLHLLWWIPQILYITINKYDQINSVVQYVKAINASLLFQISVNIGWQLGDDESLLFHLNLIALIALIYSLVVHFKIRSGQRKPIDNLVIDKT